VIGICFYLLLHWLIGQITDPAVDPSPPFVGGEGSTADQGGSLSCQPVQRSLVSRSCDDFSGNEKLANLVTL